ncbi:SMI1/KNR4 family protein [Micromonospora sp. DT31]|uniref:SMI1/KNR4 family protein n=1 Tax=Micromonospora sp. DT31 TaxID=3393434 RepID=UPI003CF8B2F9
MIEPDAPGVASAWARIEAGLSRVLPESLPLLAPPAGEPAIDAVEAALGVTLPPDFRESLRVHDGTGWGLPSPVPLDHLYDTGGIVEATRMWRENADPDADGPAAWAHLVDTNHLSLAGPVRPAIGGPGHVMVGDMNGDVRWFLDFDPAPGGTSGQVVRVDIECGQWGVLAPSWRDLLLRYATDLESYAVDPDGSPLDVDPDTGPACEWGLAPDAVGVRPDWLRDVRPEATGD